MGLAEFLKVLRSRVEEKRFPFITSSVLSLGAGIAILGRGGKSEGCGVIGYIVRAGGRMYRALTEEDRAIPTLPPQNQGRPTVVFDSEDFLVKKRFSPLRLDFLVAKRAFADPFLFHAAHIYELVHVSESPAGFSRLLLGRIDPYGCIAYKVYCKDKKMFAAKHLNRPLDKVVVISTKENEYHEDFGENTLRVGRWRGEAEHGLLDLLNFLHNLRFAGIEDYRGTLRSYFGKNFSSAFDKVQRRIFVQRNLFSWDVGRKYRDRVDEINKKRVCDFEDARVMMDADLRGRGSGEKSPALEFVLGLATKLLF